jgi:hypothetical protein
MINDYGAMMSIGQYSYHLNRVLVVSMMSIVQENSLNTPGGVVLVEISLICFAINHHVHMIISHT